MSKDFTHLHVHTEYSILDGINKIPALCNYVKNQGMSACSITDHGTLYGIIEFYKEAKKIGINPLIGVEAYITGDEDGIEDNKFKTRDNHHCIIIAQNEQGLRNLLWLTNQANRYNFYYRPRISISNLEKRAEGLAATTSCLGGIISKRGEYIQSEIGRNQFRDNENHATNALENFASIFNGRFYLEIQDNPEFWQQEVYNYWLIRQAKEMSLPLVITSDAHFLSKADKNTHNLIMAQQMKCTLNEYIGDEDGMHYGDGHYIRSPEEMLLAAKKCNAEEAFWNTGKIAESVNLDMKLGEVKMPSFDIEEEEDYNEFLSWKATRYECNV